MGVQLVSIQTSPNDHFLWAIDNRGTVFVRTGLCEEMPVGTGWEMVPGMYRYRWVRSPGPPFCCCDGSVVWRVCVSGLAVSQLVISSWTVWVRCINGDLARRYGVTDRNPAGDYWKKIPGQANCLTGEPDRIATLTRSGVGGGSDSRCVSPCLLSDPRGRVVGRDRVWRAVAAPDEGPPDV